MNDAVRGTLRELRKKQKELLQCFPFQEKDAGLKGFLARFRSAKEPARISCPETAE